MRALPILVITNALALALVLVLYVKQQDLESQVGSGRTTTRSAEVAEDTSMLRDRVERLEQRLASRDSDVAVPAARTGFVQDAGASAEQSNPTRAGSDPAPAPEDPQLSGEEMEVFRRKVSKANELNREEQRVRGVVERVDRLIEENKVAPLTASQKQTVARTILSTRAKFPQVFARMRNPDFRALPREERGKIIRDEMQSLRTEAQTALEDEIPAADAKVIIEDSMSERNLWRGMFGGGRGGDRGRGASPRVQRPGGQPAPRSGR